MNIEEQILKVLKKENPDVEIGAIRGLVKSHENEWSFRYTFRDGDYLAISEINKVQCEGLSNFILLTKKKKKNKIKKIVLKK